MHKVDCSFGGQAYTHGLLLHSRSNNRSLLLAVASWCCLLLPWCTICGSRFLLLAGLLRLGSLCIPSVVASILVGFYTNSCTCTRTRTCATCATCATCCTVATLAHTLAVTAFGIGGWSGLSSRRRTGSALQTDDGTVIQLCQHIRDISGGGVGGTLWWGEKGGGGTTGHDLCSGRYGVAWLRPYQVILVHL